MFESVDIYEMDQVEEKTGRFLSLIPEEFWISPWLIQLQDNSVVRTSIKSDLNQVARNHRIPKRAWYDGLKVVGKEAVTAV